MAQIATVNDEILVHRRRGRPPGRPQENVCRSYGGKLKFSAAEVKAALLVNFGNPCLAAAALIKADRKKGGRTITARAIRRYLETRPEWKIPMSARSDALDLAESNVINALRARDAGRRERMTRWVLDRLGKERGYSPTGEPVPILDPARLTVEQLLMLLDPARLRDDQLDGILEFLSTRFGNQTGDPQVIDHEPMPSTR